MLPDGQSAGALLRGLWRRTEVALLTAYVFAIPLPNFSGLPDGLREVLYNRRPFFLIGFLGAVILGRALLDFQSIVRLARSRTWLWFVLLSGLFPSYYAVLALRKEEPSWASVGLYGAWALFTSVVAPLLLAERRSIARIARNVCLCNLAVFAVAGLASLGGLVDPYRFGARLSLGFENPNYFSQILEAAAFAYALYLTTRTRGATNSGVAFWYCAVAVALGVAVLAESRNVVFGLVVAFVSRTWLLPLLRRSPLRALAFGAVLAGVLVPLGSLVPWENVDTDRLSSGRISLWGATLTAVMADASPTVAALFGPERLPQLGLLNVYDPMAEVKAFQKYHVDNAYLEYFVEGGLVGLGLAMLPVLHVALLSLRFLRSREHGDFARALSAILAAALVQASFVALLPTFNSPFGFLLGLCLAMPIHMTLGTAAVRQPMPVLRPLHG